MAVANDSAATIGLGGLVAVKNNSVHMIKERLVISVDRIEVDYVFRNDDTKPVTALIAFPIPDIETEDRGDMYIDLNGKNPVSFTLEVDGKAVPFETEIKMEKTVVKIKYFWRQLFPANREVKVRHTYKPVIGFYMSDIMETALFEKEGKKMDAYKRANIKWFNSFCIDDSTRRSIKKRRPDYKVEKQKKDVIQTFNEVEYILTTATTWAGPIDDFELVIKKSNPDQIISLCLDGIKKTSPTTFTWKQKNFVPKKELKIIFLPAG